jgi:uncharacterized membrane protein (DUF2068 family)
LLSKFNFAETDGVYFLISVRTSKKNEGSKRGLHIVAVFEAIKGLLVLLVGFGLLTFLHKDIHSAAEQLVAHFHLNPARHYPQIFIDAASHMTDRRLLAMAVSALLYSVVRFAEAFGLWRQRQWAEWFALLTGGMYIPVELYENLRGVTWPKVTVLTVNAAIGIYMAYVLYRSRQKRKYASK